MTRAEERPARHHAWTVDDVLRMAEVGLLGPDDRVELVEGEVVEKVVIGGPHANAVIELTALLSDLCRGSYRLSVQNPVVLDEHSAPEPDLAVLRPLDRSDRRLPTVPEVVLLVEVADSSASSDRRRKPPLYARAGIPEVWLLDLDAGLLERCTDPRAHGYALVERVTSGTMASSLDPALRLDVGDLLRRTT